MLKYLDRYDLDSVMKKVERCFVVSPENFVFNDTDEGFNMDTNIYIEQADGTSSEATLMQYLGYTQLTGRFEGATPQHIACIFANTDNIPDEIYARLTGANLANLRFLVVEKHVDLKKVDASTKKNLVKKLEKVSKIERSNPTEAKALRHAETMPKSGDLEAVKYAIEKQD